MGNLIDHSINPEAMTNFIAIKRVENDKNGTTQWLCRCKHCKIESLKSVVSIRAFVDARCKNCMPHHLKGKIPHNKGKIPHNKGKRNAIKTPPALSHSTFVGRHPENKYNSSQWVYNCDKCKKDYAQTWTSIKKYPERLHKCISDRVTKELPEEYKAMEKQRDELNKILDQMETYDFSRREKIQYTLSGFRAAAHRSKTNPNTHGTKFSKEWSDDMYQFVEDAGLRPPTAQLDRIDSRLGYIKGNVWWSDVKSNMRNKIDGVFYKSLKTGEVKCQAHWCVDMGIGSNILKPQIKKGWHPDLIRVDYDAYVSQQLARHANKPNPFPDGTHFKNGDQHRMQMEIYRC